MSPKIVVLDGYTLNPGDNPWTELSELGELVVYDRTSPQEILQRVKDAEIILTNKTRLDKRAIEEAGNLKFIAVLATGYDVVDIQAAGRRGIPVSNVPEYGTNTVAEHTFALVLELARRPALHDSAIRAGEWKEDWCFWKVPLVELAGKTMGIVGFGRIGRRVGQIANAFGMEVIAYDVQRSNEPDYRPFRWVSLEELFSISDFVSLHCNQTEENKGFVNMELLKRMKPTAFLINTSRGGLVKEEDLARALEEGIIAGAALDVFPKEPLDRESPLFGAPNLVMTPHLAWATLGARKRLMRTTVENVKAFLRGNPRNVVNAPWLEAEKAP
jgi:glycerate dehydrogenase